jgi:hypothetical protein
MSFCELVASADAQLDQVERLEVQTAAATLAGDVSA